MNLKECYISVGGDYEDVMRRLAKEERIKKFLLRTVEDSNFTVLADAIAAEDYETAFRAAHTIKGLCLNMGLRRLADSSSSLTENLRNMQSSPQTEQLFERVMADYQELADTVRQLEID